MEDAVRIALQYNQALRAQRLNIDQSKADEITASLKPNPILGNLVDTIPIFSPQTHPASDPDLCGNPELHRGARRANGRSGSRWPRTTRISRPRPSPTTSASCGFRWSRHSSTFCWRNPFSNCRQDDLANYSQRAGSEPGAPDGGRSGGRGLHQAVSAEAPIRAGCFLGAVEPGAGQGESPAAAGISIGGGKLRCERNAGAQQADRPAGRSGKTGAREPAGSAGRAQRSENGQRYGGARIRQQGAGLDLGHGLYESELRSQRRGRFAVVRASVSRPESRRDRAQPGGRPAGHRDRILHAGGRVDRCRQRVLRAQDQ